MIIVPSAPLTLAALRGDQFSRTPQYPFEAPPNSRTYDIALHSVLTQHMKYGKRYSAQFKRDAVELLISGKSISELSLDLHVGVPTLWRWKKEYLRDLDGRLPKDSTPSAVQLEAENQRLRRENRQLQQNQDILKKALGILGGSKETLPPGMP
jgi:transposase-like protein